MPDIVSFLLSQKEAISVAATAFGLAKTGYEFLQARSRAATRDKVLLRIQSLLAARAYIGPAENYGQVASAAVAAILDAQLSEAFVAFERASRRLEETQAIQGRLTPAQRIFLLYKPPTARAWVPHLLCWASALFMFLLFFASWFPTDDSAGDGSWNAFLSSWSSPDFYIAFLFFVGIFLLTRLWGIYERKKYLGSEGAIATSNSLFVPTLIACFYWLFGVGFVIAAVVLGLNSLETFTKFSIMGLASLGCGATIYLDGKIRFRGKSLPKAMSLLLALPPALMLAEVLFDLGGVLLKKTANHPLDYWRSLIVSPILLLLLVALAAAPVASGIRCVRSAWGKTSKAITTGATESMAAN